MTHKVNHKLQTFSCNVQRATALRGQYLALALLTALYVGGCATTSSRSAKAPAADYVKKMEITAYCPCKKCCGWHRTWLGKAVTKGGYPKKVGVTASGAKARPGTIAADTSVYPFGTQMYIPGYGYGTVQDRGGAIKGNRIDLFFNSHRQALQWGRVKDDVYVWLPGSKTARN